MAEATINNPTKFYTFRLQQNFDESQSKKKRSPGPSNPVSSSPSVESAGT
ncbi:hypothetical protein HanHA89_Chr14g0584651 [Helianthus annuus]|nr:hypothetical protein HanHA89_Chr14g0584651 [Helianthus annuus]